jgi:magnesium-transporting ATPase (P-type)
MAYDYKPGEDDDLLKKYLYIAGIVVFLAVLTVIILYVGLGVDSSTLPILLRKIKLDATNVTFVFIFVIATIALWIFFRDSAATEGVTRRQTYFIIILIIAGVAIAGTIYFRRLSKPSSDVVRTEVCDRCGGNGRAKLRPEYPCAACAGTGKITP